VGVAIPWDQPYVDTTVYTNVGQREVSWVENFEKAANLNNIQPFVSHDAAIFQVPEGTARFNARLYTFFESWWHDFNLAGGNPVSRTERRDVTLSAPVFRVAPASITVLPRGTATLSLEAVIPAYSAQGLKWAVISVPAGFSVSPISGSGPQQVTVRATSAAPGDVDVIQFQTDPPYAAPSVARAPLQVQVTVVASPSELPPNGVLLAGGQDASGTALSSAEVWNPATNSSTLIYPMNSARYRHTATLLPDGTILIAGGFNVLNNPQSSAEIFSPSTGKFTLTAGSMTTPRALHTATLLTSGPLAGQVLIAGGCCGSNNSALNSAELYNPATQRFTATGVLSTATMGQTATLLLDGTVLLTGGTNSLGSLTSLANAQIYNPQTRTFQLTRNLNNARQGQAATLLTNGQVLVAGGWRVGDDPTNTVELYTPGSASFTFTGNMSNRRRYQAAVLLTDGTVLEAGGLNGANSAETYNPNTCTFTSANTYMTEYRNLPTATLILNTETAADTQVLIAGGVEADTGITGGKGLDLYNPSSLSFSSAGQMTTPRSGLTATLFNGTR